MQLPNETGEMFGRDSCKEATDTCGSEPPSCKTGDCSIAGKIFSTIGETASFSNITWSEDCRGSAVSTSSRFGDSIRGCTELGWPASRMISISGTASEELSPLCLGPGSSNKVSSFPLLALCGVPCSAKRLFGLGTPSFSCPDVGGKTLHTL